MPIPKKLPLVIRVLLEDKTLTGEQLGMKVQELPADLQRIAVITLINQLHKKENLAAKLSAEVRSQDIDCVAAITALLLGDADAAVVRQQLVARTHKQPEPPHARFVADLVRDLLGKLPPQMIRAAIPWLNLEKAKKKLNRKH